MAGGEVDRGSGFERLLDYWVLNTQTFQWLQIPSQMPCPLIEPRLTACHSGNIYVWGDFDQPLPGMPPNGTHLRILRVSGLEKASHPPAYSTYNPAPPAYPSLDEKSGNPPYPSNPSNQPYPSNNYGNQGIVACNVQNHKILFSGGQGQAPPYPSYNPNQSNYGNAGNQQGPSQDQYGNAGYDANQQGGYTQTSDGQNAYYPTQKKKKSCSIQ